MACFGRVQAFFSWEGVGIGRGIENADDGAGEGRALSALAAQVCVLLHAALRHAYGGMGKPKTRASRAWPESPSPSLRPLKRRQSWVMGLRETFFLRHDDESQATYTEMGTLADVLQLQDGAIPLPSFTFQLFCPTLRVRSPVAREAEGRSSEDFLVVGNVGGCEEVFTQDS